MWCYLWRALAKTNQEAHVLGCMLHMILAIKRVTLHACMQNIEGAASESLYLRGCRRIWGGRTQLIVCSVVWRYMLFAVHIVAVPIVALKRIYDWYRRLSVFR